MALSLPAASRNAACDAVVDRCDAGGAGSIEIRTGSKPASADDAATGTLLATIPLAATAFGAAVAGVATLQGVPLSDTSADNTGTAGWARVKSGGGATVFDGTVTASGGGGDFTLASTSVVAGTTVRLTSGTVTMPA
jgi:hypothetical protein